MSQLLGVHITFGTYGFWLPNDPRGSGSEFVWSDALKPFGPATGLADRRRSRAFAPHDRGLRLAAKRALQRPPVKFTGLQARAVGRGFSEYAQNHRIPVWACAILPDHVHLVVDPAAVPSHDL